MAPSDEFAPAIRRLQQDIKAKEAEILGLKQTVNTLCGYAGVASVYSNLDAPSAGDFGSLRRDQFFGVPLATAVKDYLNMRGDPKAGGAGAATVNEIFAALKDGGFHFEAKNDDNAKRGLRISLSKNTASFIKVPGGAEGAFGLADWYPAAKVKAPEATADVEEDQEKQTDPDLKDQSPPESIDVSDTYHSDDASEPKEKGETDGLASHPDFTG